MKRDVRRRAKDRDGDSSQPGWRRVEVEKKMGGLGLTVVAAWTAEWAREREQQLATEEDHRRGSRKVASERLRDVRTSAAKEVEDMVMVLRKKMERRRQAAAAWCMGTRDERNREGGRLGCNGEGGGDGRNTSCNCREWIVSQWNLSKDGAKEKGG
ncbi:hypothetical protein AMTR_s00080p00151530 [Amborella trichopoda]|uniref:Uncharacterized protein n=1 Tax=Amborella trichopoda TaxID=13333 RepID=W1PB70_AMBTC|nr:hypothetical protein AMTR_s00080p00151530 [Amborella trichopoda]